jgi:hypothetical protein
MENAQGKMVVWLVAPGEDYAGESVDQARLFYSECDARVYEIELADQWGVDYVVVREMEVG